ncbi:hypothetical protein B0H13DRAFT_1591861 [Mycena leptocephala]|nr:hypothetical protein B0H13DRAFT_1591861 [Mycena leptocephala]
MAICAFCQIEFGNGSLVRRHQLQSPACKNKFEASLGTRLSKLTSRRRRRPNEVPQSPELPSTDNLAAILDDIPLESDLASQQQQDSDNPASEDPDQDASIPTRPPQERPGERPQWYRTPDEKIGAGATYGPSKTAFELIRDGEILKGGTVLGPFRDDDEWQLAKWLIKHVGHTATEEFLKLPIVRRCFSMNKT